MKVTPATTLEEFLKYYPSITGLEVTDSRGNTRSVWYGKYDRWWFRDEAMGLEKTFLSLAAALDKLMEGEA